MTHATVDCPDAAPDRPDVIVFPPVIPLATLAIACVLQWLAPLGWIADFDQGWRIGAGAFTLFVGFLTTSAGGRALLRHGTNVNQSSLPPCSSPRASSHEPAIRCMSAYPSRCAGSR